MSEQAKTVPSGGPPVRGWWRRKLFLVPVILLVGLIAARFGWEAYADHVLQSRIDELIARGEKLDWRDQAPPAPVPDDQNAVLLYQKALGIGPRPAFFSPSTVPADSDQALKDAELRRRLGETGLIEDLTNFPDLRRSHAQDLRQILQLTAEARTIVRQARSLPGADWKVDYSVTPVKWILPLLSGYRQMAKILCMSAAAAHDSGDDDEALECMEDCLAMSRAVGTHPTLVGYLVSVAMTSLACQTTENIAPTLSAGPPPKARPATCRRLIKTLLDDRSLRQQLLTAAMLERSFTYEWMERVRLGQESVRALYANWSPGPAPYTANEVGRVLMRPLYTLDEADTLGDLTASIEAARKTDYPSAAATIPDPPAWLKSDFARHSHPLGCAMTPASTFKRVQFLHYQAVAIRRATAVILALRLYQLDKGRRCEKLSELVPDYLPALPADPFVADGRSFVYRPDARPPILYSLGENGTDDGGQYDADNPFNSKDIVFVLDGSRPKGTPTWTDPDSQPAEAGTQPAPQER